MKLFLFCFSWLSFSIWFGMAIGNATVPQAIVLIAVVAYLALLLALLSIFKPWRK